MAKEKKNLILIACAITGVLLLLAIGIILITFVSRDKTGRPWGSPYSADYTMSDDVMEVKVTGPSAKLGVILTDPKGKSTVEVIPAEKMISNSETARIHLYDLNEGTWVLAVKTFDPEKVVWEKEIAFSVGQVTVKDMRFDFKQNLYMGPGRGFMLTNIHVTLQKTGNLPVYLTAGPFTCDGPSDAFSIATPQLLIAKPETTFDLGVYGRPLTDKQKRLNKQNEDARARGESFLPLPALEGFYDAGERHNLEGTFFYGDKKRVMFKKDFLVPSQ